MTAYLRLLRNLCVFHQVSFKVNVRLRLEWEVMLTAKTAVRKQPALSLDPRQKSSTDRVRLQSIDIARLWEAEDSAGRLGFRCLS
jgi:hypothetical protein